LEEWVPGASGELGGSICGGGVCSVDGVDVSLPWLGLRGVLVLRPCEPRVAWSGSAPAPTPTADRTGPALGIADCAPEAIARCGAESLPTAAAQRLSTCSDASFSWLVLAPDVDWPRWPL